MLREKATASQREYEIVLLEELVPEDHLLRKIEGAVDFSFIHDLCKGLYSPNIGRPAVPPELLFRLLFLGYLYGIKSEVKLAQMVNENIAFKWFLGLKLTEKGPDHATISINRVRRFRENNIAEKVFDEVLRQCMDKGLVGGQVLYTDATHVKAKANKHRKRLVTVEETPASYMAELDAQIDLDRKELGKKPFDRDDDNGDPPSGGKTRMESTTDPDSGQLNKEGKPDGFHYSEHRTVDSKHNVIVNIHITPANVNDITLYRRCWRKSKSDLAICPGTWGWTPGTTAHRSRIRWKRRESRASSATAAIHTRKSTTGNTGSSTTHTSTPTSVPKTSASTGRQPHAKATGNTSATGKIAQDVPGGRHVSARRRPEGW